MISRRRVLRLPFAAALFASGGSSARSQEPQPVGAADIVARIPGEFFLRPYYAINAAGPDGQVRFEIDPKSPARRSGGGDFFNPGNGHALMFVRPAAAPDDVRLYRVDIEEITAVDVPAWGFTATMTPAVASQLRAGDHVALIHPPCTTRQLRDLPDAIPFSDVLPTTPDQAREAAAKPRSINNLKQIGLALHNFHSTNDKFPPAVIHGPDGKPWHSWRVLLLPYLEQAALYNQYRFDEPWDGANNRQLLDRMPDVFRDPIHGDTRGQFTHYAALVGEATVFPPSGAALRAADRSIGLPIGRGAGGATGIRDILDGTSNTIVIAPVAPDRAIPWTKPDDIAVGPDFAGLGRPGGIAAPYRALSGPEGHHAAPVLFADGSVLTLIDTVDPQVLAALMTRAGGEVISATALPTDRSPAQVPPVVTIRIRRDGGQARATIEQAQVGPGETRVQAPLTPPSRTLPAPAPGAPR